VANGSQEEALQWGTIDLSALLDGLTPLTAIIEGINAFTDTLSGILEILKAAINVAANFLIGIEDVFTVIYETLYDLIMDTIQQLTQTGIYNIVHYTPSLSMELTPVQWCSQVGNSLFDIMDSERPILVDPEAFVCSVALVTTSDSIKELYASWNQLCSMLGMFTGALFGQHENWRSPGDALVVSAGVGQFPNWKSLRLSDIFPGMNQAADYLMGLLDTLKPTSQKSDILARFAAFLDQKIYVLQMYGQKILAVIGLISAILNIEGVYTLVIEGQGDASWVRERLNTATGGPHDYGKYDSSGNLLPEAEQRSAEYTLGALFLITGGSLSAVSVLSSFFTGTVFPAPNSNIPQVPDLP
jgi:hypothetical protein